MDLRPLIDCVVSALPVGAYSVVIVGLSSWLGSVWAQRINERERAKNATLLESLKHDLDIMKEQNLKFFHERVQVYNIVVDILSEAIGDVVFHMFQGKPVPNDIVFAFDKKRMKAYGYLAMRSPQSVIDAYDSLTDLIFSMIENPSKYDWSLIREKAIAMINECRKDIGFNPDPITYNGSR